MDNTNTAEKPAASEEGFGAAGISPAEKPTATKAASKAATKAASVTPSIPNYPRCVRIKDDHLARVLAGTEFLLFDGAMGTQLQEAGLEAGELPELLCLTEPEKITQIHERYVTAGSEVVTTNTFGANAKKLGSAATVEQVFSAAIACARAAHPRYVAADIGPTGALLRPLGTMPFDEAYELFAQQVRAADAAGADLFIIETMADILETKAAILAAKENSDLPIFCTMTFGEDGRSFLGTTPELAAVTLSALGVDVVGINCSLGPADVAPLVARMTEWASCPVMAQANAGLPSVVDGKTVYSIGPDEYCQALVPMLDAGVTILGGCCGTSPTYIAGERSLLDSRQPAARAPHNMLTTTSAQELFSLAAGEVGIIGERINPTGKPRLKEALKTGNFDYVMGEAISQVKAGAQVLDVNAGLPEIDEQATLVRLVEDLQGITTKPLQIDSADPKAIEAAVRIYPGKPIINSVNAKDSSLKTIIPIAKHYGCALVGLCLGDAGIPDTAEGRFELAQRIVYACDEAGIARQDILIDCLTMAVSTDQQAPRIVLDTIKLVKSRLEGVRCVLGVSNVSFGLPYRDLLNATFLVAAFEAGLDMAIMNPLSQRFMDAVDAWRVFNGEDERSTHYIEANANRSDTVSPVSGATDAGGKKSAAAETNGLSPDREPTAESAGTSTSGGVLSPAEAIRENIIAGRKEPVARAVAELLASAADSAASDASASTAVDASDSASDSASDPDASDPDASDPDASAPTASDPTASDPDTTAPLTIIDEMLIPALDEVGDLFEKGRFFLPQLMASAEAAKAGFEVIRQNSTADSLAQKEHIALATVKGDIHDIGKNIVKMLLENYGYQVHDLGRDVDPQVVVNEVVAHNIKLAGLSALMTTTVPAMAETIELLREQAPWCKVMVGGAVLNPEYAELVGADFYAKDANESAKIAAEVLG